MLDARVHNVVPAKQPQRVWEQMPLEVVEADLPTVKARHQVPRVGHEALGPEIGRRSANRLAHSSDGTLVGPILEPQHMEESQRLVARAAEPVRQYRNW